MSNSNSGPQGKTPSEARRNFAARNSMVEPGEDEPKTTEATTPIIRESRDRNAGRTRNIIISVIFGILAYIVLVVLAMLVGFGGLLIQLSALVVAVVLARGLYGFLKKPFGSGNGMN